MKKHRDYAELLQWRYLWKFGSVGGMGAVVDNIVLVGLVEGGYVTPMVGKVVSAEAAIVSMFVVNEVWTFANYGDWTLVGLGKRFAKSNLVRIGGLVVGIVTMYVLFVVADLWYLLSNVIGIGLGFTVNYVFECIFTWDIVNADHP